MPNPALSALRRLSALLVRTERLLERLDHRQALLDRMRILGEEIDAAWRQAQQPPLDESQRARLLAFQQRRQQRIEKLRQQAEGIAAACQQLQAETAQCLLDLAVAFPAVLPLADQARASAATRRRDQTSLQRNLLAARQLLEETQRACRSGPPVEAARPEATPVQAAEPGLLKADAVARALGVSVKTVYRLAAQGLLAAVRVGRSVRFRRQELDAFLTGPRRAAGASRCSGLRA